MITLFERIINHIFGRKYYLVTLEEIQYSKEMPTAIGKRSVSNYIFRNREDAKTYFYQMKSNKTFRSVEIVTFRSREYYCPIDNYWRI